jgi:F-type H+-transporting ATPase subunit a
MLPLAVDNSWIDEHLKHVSTSGYELVTWAGWSHHVTSLFVASALMLLIFPAIAKQDGVVPHGRARNFFEVILLFIRDEVAKPFLGHNTTKFLPMLWNFFFFILFCNLLGLVPGMATATGQLWVTGSLAAIAFVWYQAMGIHEQGLIPYVKNIVPPGLPIWLIPPLFVIEVIGHLVKPVALTIRLWANMTGGHAVLYAFLSLIFFFGTYAIAPVSVACATGVYMLEIFVAFVQAYVFTFLVTVFLAGATHPEH